MVFFSDIRAPAVKISLNANLVRFVLEEHRETTTYTENYIEMVTRTIEYRLANIISAGTPVKLFELIIETEENITDNL